MGHDTLFRVSCVQADITAESVDAIVNAANKSLRGGGGVDGAIHRAAGTALLEECIDRYPDGCATGEARITAGHALAARFVIHTPGPVYVDGTQDEPDLLAACYRNSLTLAADHGCKSVAFPAISCGIYSYPVRDAARIALATIGTALSEHPGIDQVRMVLFDQPTLEVFAAALDELR